MTILRFLPVIIVLLCSMTSLASVRVIESTPARLVLSWEMAGFDTIPVSDGAGRLRTGVSFDGGHVATGDSGGVLLPGYSIHAGVPRLGDVQVRVEPEELSVVRVNRPLERRGTAVDQFEPVFSSVWISDPYYNMVRDYRAARFVLRPVRDLGQGRIQLLRKARIVIEFPASAHSGAVWEARGDYERMAKNLLLNFNTAQGWQDRRRGMRRSASVQNPYPFDFTRQPLASFRVGGGYRHEASTDENSLIRISGKRIRKIFGDNVPINSVALYASTKGEMDINVPREGAGGIPAGVFEIPVLRYDLNGDGMVDTNDYIIAYVSGASDWSSYNTFSQQFNFVINRYSDYRTYWLTVKNSGAGVSMERFEGGPPAASNVTESFENNIFMRTPTAISAVNAAGGINWMWRRFTNARPDTVMRLVLPEHDERVPGSIQIRLGTSNGSGGLSARLGSDELCRNCGGMWYDVNSWSSRDLTLRYVMELPDARAYHELNAIHVRYTRPISISDTAGRLEIFSSTAEETVRYRMAKNSGGLAYLVRIPQDEQYVTLIDTVRQASYEWSDTGGVGIRYMAILEKDIIDYSRSLKIFDNRSNASDSFLVRDLRNTGNESDYLIVTHEAFLDASRKLAEHKTRMGFEIPKIVMLGDVLAQFGGGNIDPAAIRNFLYYVYRYWNGGGDVLSYVVLMGSGHYDYKNITTSTVNYMPVPYINNTSSDDFYVFYDTLTGPANQHDSYYFLGRFLAKSASEALTIVDKLIETEDPRFADFDPWRNRILLTADDDRVGAVPDRVRGHTRASESVARIVDRLRSDIDLRKLYLYEYEFDERHYKPGASRAFINEINNGIAIVNWFGHGSIDVIADERLFKKEDVPALNNKRRYPIFTLFSCSIGKFDHPGAESLAALLLRQPGAGAVAVMASARDSEASQNEALGPPFFEALFDTAQSANNSIGSAFAMGKRNSRHSLNRYYVTFGDPSLRLTARNRGVELAVTDTAGTHIDTLKALQRITIKGTVTDAQKLRDGNFNGFVSLTLFNPPQDSTRRKDIQGIPIDRGDEYTLPGSPVFSAKLHVANGEFEQRLLLPMNLTFGKPGVKLIAYAWKEGDTLTGAGYLDGMIFDGSEGGMSSDTLGPKISVRPIFDVNNIIDMNQANMFVRNRVTAQLPLNIEINIEAANGINVIGTGPDEGLSMEVRGALSKRSINHLLQFQEGSFSHGTAIVSFVENQLKSGTHELIISAQDLLGNVSRLSVTLDIVEPAELKLDHVINVPNPVRMGRETRFFYHHSDVSGNLNVDVTIRIYTLGGRLVEVIRNPPNGREWVPRDRHGNLLTPNVYLYQVTATSPNVGKTVKSKIKKLVVHPPR